MNATSLQSLSPILLFGVFNDLFMIPASFSESSPDMK